MNLGIASQFVAELVHNKCQRISFDCSSPNGILLFREASRLLVTYGQRILTGAPPTYKDKYKGVSICLLILSRALSGGYCNLGVFQVRLPSYMPSIIHAAHLSLLSHSRQLFAGRGVATKLGAPACTVSSCMGTVRCQKRSTSCCSCLSPSLSTNSWPTPRWVGVHPCACAC